MTTLHQHLHGLKPVGAQDPAAAPAEPATLAMPAATSEPAPVVEPVVSTAPAPAPDPAWQIEVVRSARRNRSVGAQLVGDVLRITIPSWMSRSEEQRWVDDMRARFLRRASTERIDLRERARTLARRFGLDRPDEIRWVDDMSTRWGSCTPSTRTIRISSRIVAFPDWVIDYVIVHELAHLHVAGHGDDFWRLVDRYPRSERAIGYLMAKSGED